MTGIIFIFGITYFCVYFSYKKIFIVCLTAILMPLPPQSEGP